MSHSKVTTAHLERNAYVYLRQSTLGQVTSNRESTERQYQLRDRALDLGWIPGQVRVLDDDLGKSGAVTHGRKDFHRLMAAVGLGEVGAVLALEASRLSRSQADWHRLLDVCALTHTLLIDHDGIYDPNDFNDRTLLGFKGTWSHVELHAMKLRLDGARRHAARKGEFRTTPPTGYIYDESGKLVMDLDEGVVQAIAGLFSRFRDLGSSYAVARDYAERGLTFPRRRRAAVGPGAMEHGRLTAARVLSILHNPRYAGAYVYGRCPSRPVVEDGRLVGVRQVTVPRAEWEVFIPDAHPAYITWDEYLENERLLAQNWRGSEVDGPLRPREGRALLQGLVLCGVCGRRMSVEYGGERGQRVRYLCNRRPVEWANGTRCWSVAGRTLDGPVVEHVLDAVNNDNLNISFAVLRHIQTQAGEMDREWSLRIERARHEAERAERQFDAVEPENRLVARTVEKRWEERLRALHDIEQAFETDRATRALTLDVEQQQQILELASDLPKVWHAETTGNKDRKEMLGLLVKQIALHPIDVPRRQTRVHILWHTGATSELFCDRPDVKDCRRTSPEVIALVRQLCTHQTDEAIAVVLNQHGHRTGDDLPFNTPRVRLVRLKHVGHKHSRDLRAAAALGPRPDGRYSTGGMAALLGINTAAIKRWRNCGEIDAVQERPNSPWWHSVTPEQLLKLRERARRIKARRQSKVSHKE